MDNSRSPTLKDVARIAEVSEATVSRVLNGRTNVRPETALRVTRAIEELNLDASSLIHRNRGTTTRNIGLLVPDITNPVFPMMMKGIQQVARSYGFNLVFCDSENDLEIESEHLRSMIEEPIDGLIWIPTGEDGERSYDEIASTLPVVFLDRTFQHRAVNSVCCANEDGAYQATRYLLSLGHRKILFLGGPAGTSTAAERRSGFERALAEQRVPRNGNLVLDGDFTMGGGYECIKKRITSGLDATAIFASNDAMAFGALKALREANIVVPDQISIIGYDDIAYAEFVGLSTVAQPAFELGRNAMILLVDVLEGRATDPQRIALRPILTIRDSCKKL